MARPVRFVIGHRPGVGHHDLTGGRLAYARK